jgi:TadE-like protein
VRSKLQKGTTTVEFAIVGAVLITIIFAVIEFGRTLFTFSVLNEGTRRGARVAAVCPLNDPAIAQETAFVTLPGLTTQNVTVEYLNQGGGVIANPAGNFGAIEYVRVRIVNFQYQMWIPFLNLAFTAPEFAATLPRESLGVPREGVINPC